jgi:hypothetical protein
MFPRSVCARFLKVFRLKRPQWAGEGLGSGARGRALEARRITAQRHDVFMSAFGTDANPQRR